MSDRKYQHLNEKFERLVSATCEPVLTEQTFVAIFARVVQVTQLEFDDFFILITITDS